MPQRALGPTLSQLRQSQVLPPEPDDWERIQHLIRVQNDKRVPVVDEAMDFLTGTIEGSVLGKDFNNIRSLRTYNDTGRAFGQALTSGLPELSKGGAGLAVAFGAGKPNALKMLRQRGAKTVEKVIEEGLEKRSIGGRPKDILNPIHRGKDLKDIPFVENKQLPEEPLQALSIAQQRWPRLFGHLNEVADVDAMLQLNSLAKGKVTRGTLGPGGLTNHPQGYKLGKMGLDPRYANPDAVGHELLHLKDKILNPNEDLEYGINSLVHGYENNPSEVRARAMGARFKQIYDTIQEQGGRARDAMGRNIRVRPYRALHPSKPEPFEP